MNDPGPRGAPERRPLAIGEWILDAERNELRGAGHAQRLEPKAIEVLHQLALRPGRVISRDELLTLVWPGVVVGDDALTQAVIKLRKALGDEAQSPRYIETIPKRGYRLIAAVGGSQAPSAAPAIPVPASRPRHRGVAIAIALAFAVVGLAFAVARMLDGLTVPAPAISDGRRPAESFPLVAILPLANLSGDPSRDYLSDGISGDLISSLGRFSGLRVMSWNAVQVFKGEEPAVQAVREQLAARYLVRGSVRESDGAIRVAIELSDAHTGVQLWSQRYDARGTQLFDVIDGIVTRIVGALAVKLTDIEQQRAFARPTGSPEAYDLVLRARALVRREERAANREARELLARAQALAPDYAEAWLTAGEAEWHRAAYGWIEDPALAVERAGEMARKALALPDHRAHAQAYSLLSALTAHTGQPAQALMHSARAIALNPSDADSLFRHGHALLVVGRADEAVEVFETALRYEPRPLHGRQGHVAWAYYVAGRYRQAADYAEMASSRWPEQYQFHATRAAALAQLGEVEEARRSAGIARRLNPTLTSEDAGTRLLDPRQAAKLREGLEKAGL